MAWRGDAMVVAEDEDNWSDVGDKAVALMGWSGWFEF